MGQKEQTQKPELTVVEFDMHYRKALQTVARLTSELERARGVVDYLRGVREYYTLPERRPTDTDNAQLPANS